MKKSELKNILKPLVSECIKESLLEDGLISGIIAEVVKGVVSGQPSPEQITNVPNLQLERMKRNAYATQETPKFQKQRATMMSAIGKESYNGVDLFEGTTPMEADNTAPQGGNPLAGQSPTNPGVDISSLMGIAGRHWNAHMNDLSEKERK